MLDSNLAPVCGLYCGACTFLGSQCRGCGYVEGGPFWTAQMKIAVCPLYDCCVNQKQLEHCGLCDEFPCSTFNELHDPSLSEEEVEEALHARQRELVRRKEIGTESWLKEQAASSR